MASVEVPDELARVLRDNPTALALFEAMPPSHRRRYAEHVSEAKRPETRQRRAAKMLDLILSTNTA